MSARDHARALLRQLAWPVWKRLWGRIEMRVAPLDRRLSVLEAGLGRPLSLPTRLILDTPAAARLDAFDTAWRQHVPALLAATTRAAAAADLTEGLQRRVEALEAQQQQLRAEQASALRAMVPGGMPGDGTVVLRTLGPWPEDTDLRLFFLGPNVAPRAGYVTVATRPGPDIDLLSSGTGLPFAPGQVAEIMADRFLETLDPGHWRRAVLPHWRSLLCPGGRLHLRLLNPDVLLREIADGQRSSFALRDGVAGADALLLHWPDVLQAGLEANGFRLTDAAPPATAPAGGLPMTDILAIRN